MHLNLNEFIDEQRKGLTELLENLSKSRVAAARNAARQSAARIKSLNGRVRALARSGVRLTAVSQGAAQSLIELHAEIVDSALTEAAAQIERLAYTENVRDLARLQTEVLQATRQRIVADIERTVGILKSAAGDARKVVASQPAPAAPARKARARAGQGVKAKPAGRAAGRAAPARGKVASRKPAGRKTARGKSANRKTARR